MVVDIFRKSKKLTNNGLVDNPLQIV